MNLLSNILICNNSSSICIYMHSHVIPSYPAACMYYSTFPWDYTYHGRSGWVWMSNIYHLNVH